MVSCGWEEIRVRMLWIFFNLLIVSWHELFRFAIVTFSFHVCVIICRYMYRCQTVKTICTVWFWSTGMKSSSGKSVPDSELRPSSVCVAGELNRSQGEEGRVYTLQKDNSRLQEQLRKSEELNATLRSELDLTHSILTHTQNQDITLTTHTQSSSSVTHTHSQSQTTDTQPTQNESVHTSISSGRDSVVSFFIFSNTVFIF